MKIKTLNNFQNDENTYIVFDENSKTGIVIDPGYECGEIIKAAQEDNINIKYIFITHCHYDHISALEELRENSGALLVSGDKGSINIGDPDINLSPHGLGYYLSAKKSDIILKDNEKMEIDGLSVKCIYTPGHTNCGVCYLVNDNILFSGDTLFLRSIGRNDLPTGNGSLLEKSIKEKIYILDDNIEVYTGHGKKTSIGYEKKFNLFVKG